LTVSPFSLFYEATVIARAQDSPAARQESAHICGRQFSQELLVKQPVEAVLDADDAQPILASRRLHHRANDRVQSGRIAPARQYADGLIQLEIYPLTRGGSYCSP
jgi:hypothetical protein